jgi:hypothetical protein
MGWKIILWNGASRDSDDCPHIALREGHCSLADNKTGEHTEHSCPLKKKEVSE